MSMYSIVTPNETELTPHCGKKCANDEEAIQWFNSKKDRIPFYMELHQMDLAVGNPIAIHAPSTH